MSVVAENKILAIIGEAIQKLSLDETAFLSALEIAQEDLSNYVLETALRDISKLQTPEYVNTVLLMSLRIEMLSSLLFAVSDKKQELASI